MAAASKRFGYARGEKVMKEIRGGLPEKDANNNVINLKQKIFILKGLDICKRLIACTLTYNGPLSQPN